MDIQPGVTAVIGAGGKTTLVRALAKELAGSRARVIVATSTKMFVPDWCPVLLDASLDEVRTALAAHSIVCVGTVHEPTGKLAAPAFAFSELAALADYVLVEADGAKMLPLKAHAEHEPVVPACARRVVCVVGMDGVGKPASRVCHRVEVFARLAGISTEAPVTPEAVAAVLNAEALHDMVLINKVHSAADWQAAERIAALLRTPVVAGSLWEEEFRCLR